MRDGAKAVSRSKAAAEPQPSDWDAGSKPAPKNPALRGLTLVATPIGNLDDITYRAVKLLESADLIACEDTRVTGKLLTLLGIPSKKLTPYHEHNAEKARPALMARMREGAAVVLVSDAGTPLVSDPGFRLVRACLEEDIPVTSAPGASALLTALQLSGLPSDRFLFAGFLPNKDGARRSVLSELAAVPASLIFYESPHRLEDSLAAMAELLPGREAAVARELTKLYEEVRRGSLVELAAHYKEAGGPKGEVVIVVSPPPEAPPPTEEDLDAQLTKALESHSPRDAAALVAAALGLPKRTVYGRAVELAGQRR